MNEHWENKSGNWDFESLYFLKYEECEAVFRSLPAPDPEEMNGEYSGHMLNYIQPRVHALADGVTDWLGKCFRPVSIIKGVTGEGYNAYRSNGVYLRGNQLAWKIGPSRLDGQPAMLADYKYFDNDLRPSQLIDEIRKAGEGLYFGMGISDASELEPVAWKPNYFILVGPRGSWVGADKDDPIVEGERA